MSNLSDEEIEGFTTRVMRMITTLSEVNPATLTDEQRAVRLKALTQAIEIGEPLLSEQIDREIALLTRTPTD